MSAVIAWFARNRVSANLLMLALVVGGLLSVPRIPLEIFPEVRVETITVTVPYRGAGPEEVEQSVCVPIEERLNAVEGIERLTSQADEGVGVVTIELESGTDVRRALDDVKTQVDAIDTFPVETERPIVQQAVLRTQVINVAVAGDVGEHALRAVAQQVRDEIVARPGITHAELANARPYEVAIEVSEAALRRHGLTFDEVATAVRRASLDVPGGSIKTAGGEVLLRTTGQAYRGREFEALVVRAEADGTRLVVGDVARVVDGFEETDTWARFDGRPAIVVQVFRVGGQDALRVAAAVRDYVAEARVRMPAGITLTTWQDYSTYLRDRLDTLLGNARVGFGLVLIVLALFLRLRFALWIGIGVPIAILGTLWCLPTFGVTLNMLSLLAFLVVLGILVDDAIVVGENVYAHQERTDDRLAAVVAGTQEVAVPVVFGVLTTMAAFSPLLFLPGAMGKLVASVPIIIITALFFSLVEANLVLPAHLVHAGREGVRAARGWRRVQDRVAAGLDRFIERVYAPLLARVLAWRYLAAACGLAALVLTIGLVAGGWSRFVFVPEIEGDSVVAYVTMPQGTPAEVTELALARLERSAEAVRREVDGAGPASGASVFRHVLSSVGEQPYRQRQESERHGRATTNVSAGHLGEVHVELVPSEARAASSEWIAQRWRERTGPIPDAVELVFTSTLMAAGAAIDVELRGADVEDLRAAATALKTRLAAYPGVFDIADSFRGGRREIKLDIQPGAQALGLTLADLARQVRQAFYGEEAQRMQRGRDDVRVMVRYPRAERRSLGDVEEMRVRTPDGAAVPFAAVARAEQARGFSSIKRIDRQRVIVVTADVNRAVVTPNEVATELRRRVMPEILAEVPGVSYRMGGEQREQAEFFVSIRRGFLIALCVIFGLLAVPLGSYLQPLLIMSAIPFGMVGAVWGHFLMRWPLNMFSVIGMVALSGIVVNDSLVLVDWVNRARARGVPLLAAVRQAGRARFRPILLTSLTTFAGLTPLLLERGLQAQFLIPMAISLAFGVIFATVITLVLVPVWYLILQDLIALRRPRAAAVPHAGLEW